MFNEPKVGTTSLSMPPVMSDASPPVMGKHGGRIRTRYGVPLPSETR
jgi:hypothetical protein